MVGWGTVLGWFARRVCRVSVSGEAHLNILDRGGPALIVVNHTTAVDVVVVLGTLHNMGFTCDAPCEGVCHHRRHIRPIGTSDLWKFPFSKQACEASGIIPVDEHDGRAGYRAGLKALHSGACVLIYPEGDTKNNAEASPRRWRRGASGLATSGRATVLPIAHHDSRALGAGSHRRAIMTGFSRFFHPPKIHLTIGTPCLPEALASMSAREANEYLEARLQSTWRDASDRTPAR